MLLKVNFSATCPAYDFKNHFQQFQKCWTCCIILEGGNSDHLQKQAYIFLTNRCRNIWIQPSSAAIRADVLVTVIKSLSFDCL